MSKKKPSAPKKERSPRARILEKQDGKTIQNERIRKTSPPLPVEIVETIKLPRGTTGIKAIKSLSKPTMEGSADKPIPAIDPNTPDKADD